MAEEAKEMSNQPELLGVWTPASNSNLSVQHGKNYVYISKISKPFQHATLVSEVGGRSWK